MEKNRTLRLIKAVRAVALSIIVLFAPTLAQSAQPVDMTDFAKAAAENSPLPGWKDLTPERFRAKYNEYAAANGSDKIISVNKNKSGFIAKLSDTKFQDSVKMLKQLNLANGQFIHRTRFLLKTDRTGKINKIMIVGVRQDPANLGSFINAVGGTDAVLRPSETEEDRSSFLGDLKLMRGNDDSTIGQPVSAFNSGGAYTCLYEPSTETMLISCAIEPRS